MHLNYVFGKPVGAARPLADGPRPLFVLGAYPSAMHVRWWVPGKKLPVHAIAVDDEPEPFWCGDDELSRIEHWSQEIGFCADWGSVGPVGRLNGSSGVWLDERILKPLGLERSAAWITDCLDTYCESSGAALRLAEPAIVEAMTHAGIPPARHRPHPSEDEIVREAIERRSGFLLGQLTAAAPELVITLGNAALRVFVSLVESQPSVKRLSARPESYGRPLSVRIAGQSVEWLPLAHPGAPSLYQRAHDRWIAAQSGSSAYRTAGEGVPHS